jgi:flagellin-like hook-associated protein FlgL
LDIAISGSADAAQLTVSDGFGGTATVSANIASSASVTFTITGGVNSGATFTVLLTSASGASPTLDATLTYQVRGAFTGREARFDDRAANAGATATLETAQLVDGTDANDMLVSFNETNTSQIIVVSQNVQTDGLGLAVDFAQNQWRDRSDIDEALAAIEGAKTKLRGAATALNNGLDIISTRLDYTNEFVNVLAEGANKLVQADQNEEGANLLQLQTRQQLGTISLSLANQAQQAILRLF